MESSILDVVSLNNQIVLMRYDVRRSKVHLIHKLSRQAKMWKNKKGTPEQIESNKYKSERMIKEISAIKQLDDDDISKFALETAAEELQKIQNDVKLLLATRAMAKLALYKFVATSVEAFQRKHPDWQQLLPSLFEKLKKSNKKKKKAKNKISKTVKNSHNSPVNEKENFNYNDTITSLEADQSNEEHESQNENHADERKNKQERIPCIKKKEVNESYEDKSDGKHNKKIEENSSENSVTENENKVADGMKAVDPFFMTMENAEYITSQVPRSANSEDITDSFQNSTYRYDKNKTLQDKDTSKENWKHFKSKNSLFNKYDNIPSNSFESNSQVHSGTAHRKRLAHQSSEDHETPLKQEKLHPSWEAKKKLSSVAAFEGKKITFDDD